MAKAKVKIPKEVAGVKVPKTLRKEAKRALKLVESPAVRELALTGLTVAAQTLADRARANLDDPGHKRTTVALKADLDALNLGEVLRQAAVEGARRFLEGYEEGRAKKAEKGATPKRKATPPKPKKPSARSSGPAA